MAIVKSLEGHVLEGWERARSANGIPYYINHKEESTSWDHPDFTKLLEGLQKFNSIKYAAYRTAEKLKYLIRTLKLNMIKWTLIDRALLDNGYRFVSIEETVNCYKLEAILFSLCELGQTDTACTGQSAVHAELLLNLLLNMFDVERKEGVRLVYATMTLGILCVGRLLEKYKFICHHFIDKTNFIMKRHIFLVLQTLSKIPEFLGEKLSFGSHLVPAALESCCKQNCGLSEEGFLEWLFREPQTLVWLPTYSRLRAADLVIHPVRCSVCKLYPIVGFRYCCLHCLKYDVCQNCFFHGRVSKSHKTNHPMREYCQPTSSWQETKTLLKALKNRLNRGNSQKGKQSYLPIAATNTNPVSIPSDDEATNGGGGGGQKLYASLPCSAKSTPTLQRKEFEPDYSVPLSPIALSQEQQRELQSIIVRLEDENKQISKEIEKFHARSDNGSSGESRSSQGSSWDTIQGGGNGQRDFIMARQELLEDHAHQMELQIQRLKQLLKYISNGIMVEPTTTTTFSPTSGTNANGTFAARPGNWMESTPIEGRPYIPPQEWSPFVKLQSELDVLERLTSGLQENSRRNNNNRECDDSNSSSTFTSNRLRRSCRGVSFTDRLEQAEEGAGSSTPTFLERQGSVRPKFQPNGNCNNDKRFVAGSYDDSVTPWTTKHLFPRNNIPNGQSSVNYGTNSQISLPRMPPPMNNASRVDSELQGIIDQLERALPNSWSTSPTLLPEDKAKVMLAVTEVEEAMAQFLIGESQKNGRSTNPRSFRA